MTQGEKMVWAAAYNSAYDVKMSAMKKEHGDVVGEKIIVGALADCCRAASLAVLLLKDRQKEIARKLEYFEEADLDEIFDDDREV